MTRTDRWLGLGGAALFVVGVGVLFRTPGLLVSGAVAAGFLAVRAAIDAPDPSLRVERRLSDDSPDPEDAVEVVLTVTNEGGTLYDLRLVDGVPDGLEVVDGPARHATALPAGGTATFSYTVRAARGRHEWRPTVGISRDPLGADERRTEFLVESELRCVPSFEGATDLPLRGLTTPYAGRVPTDMGGSGVEFYAVREYRRGDPQARVDWNRAARTGELATLELREERAATVVLLVDSRSAAYAAPSRDAENAVERGVTASARLADVLLSEGDRVGAAAFSPRDYWLAPGASTAHRAELHEAFATHPAFAPTPPVERHRGFSPTLWRRRFRRRLPKDAQVLFVTPATDGRPVRLAKRLDALGHPVTVISPNPTADESPGTDLAAIERQLRLTDLRSAGLRVVDWADGEALSVAADRAAGRWSA